MKLMRADSSAEHFDSGAGGTGSFHGCVTLNDEFTTDVNGSTFHSEVNDA